MKDMNQIDIKAIIDWHEKTFPDSTLEGQKNKLQEEVKELMDAVDNADEQGTYDEFADCFIVCCGILRHSIPCGLAAIGALHQFLVANKLPGEDEEWDETCAKIYKHIGKSIEKKMKKNIARVWKKDGEGKYHHEEEPKQVSVYTIHADDLKSAMDKVLEIINAQESK